MKLSIIVAFLVVAYVSSEESTCGNKDPCALGYDSCVKANGGSKKAHFWCGMKYLGCKKVCGIKSKAIYYKCVVAKKDKDTCKAESDDYFKKNCPQPNPCAIKCKNGAAACYKDSKDKDTCKKEMIACFKNCCKPAVEEEEDLMF